MTESYGYKPVVDEESEVANCMDNNSSDTLLPNYTASSHPDSAYRRLFGFVREYWLHLFLLLFNVGWTLLILYRPSPTISTSDLFDVPCK
jgi:hypothetical protein